MIINVEKIDEVHLHIYCDDMGIECEIEEFFTYMVPNAKFMPKVKAGIWDGKVRLYNPIRKTLYVGLYDYLCRFAENRNYSINYINQLEVPNNLLRSDIESYTHKLNIHSKNKAITAYDYQISAIHAALNDKRKILVSPTGSGKSLIIYAMCRWLIDQGKKCIVIVPTTSLVEQMFGDFKDYSSHNQWDTIDQCQMLYSGFPKTFSKNVLFTTWQSVYKMPKSWFRQFDAVFGDEAHHFKAQSLTSIMEKLDQVEYRIGTTGSLDDSKIHTLILEGLFGPIQKVTSTSTLQQEGRLSKLKVTSLVLSYPDEIRKSCKGMEFQQELDFIVTNERRNKFLSKLALQCKGNTLMLFQFVKKHGVALNDILKDCNRPIYFIHGGTPVSEREQIRSELSSCNDAIIIASYGVYSTGINIPSIENIIFASPSKSKIRNLQSIGRGLRLNQGKSHCNLYDITDNLQWKSWKNTTMKHGAERYKLYISEDFPVKLIEVKL